MAPSVLVTGSSSGIGRVTATHLAGLGFAVLAGVRRAEDGEAVAAEHPGITPVHLDVTDAGSIERASGVAADRTLVGLVNNAGIAVAGPLELMPPEDLRDQLEVNVVGQLAVTRAMLPLLRREGGRIVNMGSVSGRIALPLLGPYAASKFALRALTDVLRVEVAGFGVTVSLVEPAGVATPIWEKSAAAGAARFAGADPERLAEYAWAITEAQEHAAHSATDGGSVDRVARAVGHALTARRPRTRYVVGRRARVGSVLGRLPDRLRDRVLLRGR